MKQLKIFLVIALLIFTASCQKERGCNDPNAQNYEPFAEVDDGSCYYYSGCTDPFALNFNPAAGVNDGSCLYFPDYFVGRYEVEEFCGDGDYFFGFSIRPHPSQPFQVYLSNFGDFGIELWATVDGEYLDIPNQNFTIPEFLQIRNALGTIEGNVLTIHYEYQFGNFSDVCSVTAFRI